MEAPHRERVLDVVVLGGALVAIYQLFAMGVAWGVAGTVAILGVIGVGSRRVSGPLSPSGERDPSLVASALSQLAAHVRARRARRDRELDRLELVELERAGHAADTASGADDQELSPEELLRIRLDVLGPPQSS